MHGKKNRSLKVAVHGPALWPTLIHTYIHTYMVRRNLETTKLNNKKNYDREVHVPKFEVGSMVLVRYESVTVADQRT
jgi:hypothetical protein